MRWFKHMANSSTDEKLAELIARHGLGGYGFWWVILETIARQMERGAEKCSASYPLSYWYALSGLCHRDKFLKMVQSLIDLGLILVQFRHQVGPNLVTSWSKVGTNSVLSMKEVIIISVPNLLKYRDEYSRKSGHVSGVCQEQETETETETETDIKITPTVLQKVPEVALPEEAKVKVKISDEEWMEEVKHNPAYGTIDVDKEFWKMKAWCETNNRLPSRRRFINWLNRVERPIGRGDNGRGGDHSGGAKTVGGKKGFYDANRPDADWLGNGGGSGSSGRTSGEGKPPS